MTYENYYDSFKKIGSSDIDIQAITENLYNSCCDMDFNDYTETAEKDKTQLENALYYIKACADNPYNNDYFRTLMYALAIAFKGVI